MTRWNATFCLLMAPLLAQGQTVESPEMVETVKLVIVTEGIDLLPELDKIGPRRDTGRIIVGLVTAELSKAEKQREMWIVLMGVYTLGLLREASATPILKQILNDPDVFYGLRYRAVTAIGKIDPAAVKQELLTLLETSSHHDSHLRYLAAEALSNLKDRDVMNRVERIGRGVTAPRSRKSWEDLVVKMQRNLQLSGAAPP